MAMDTGLIHGESVLMIDLNTCTRCDDCVRACEDIQVVGVLDVGYRGEHAEIILGADFAVEPDDPHAATTIATTAKTTGVTPATRNVFAIPTTPEKTNQIAPIAGSLTCEVFFANGGKSSLMTAIPPPI